MTFSINQLAVPAVLALIALLSFSSQYLFIYLEPAPPSKQETIVFNTFVTCLLICYTRAVKTDPGRIPTDWVSATDSLPFDSEEKKPKPRWCRRCDAPKPQRAHHCKVCKRCIPKMDHHCPWTVNCVSHITFPHFIRFVGYAVAAMSYLEYFLYTRAAVVWRDRALPAHYGPTGLQLAHLFILMIANSVTLFILSLLLFRSLWCLVVNTFTIEGWEIERHETLVRRARVFGGYLDGPDGARVRIVKQEYPFDIGFLRNIAQGMGTANVLAWFWPFASSPTIESGINFETNGFEDPDLSWPPPDPDRMPRIVRNFDPDNAFMYDAERGHLTEVEAFQQRQLEDLKRFQQKESSIRRRQIFHKRYGSDVDPANSLDGGIGSDEEGEEAWRNAEGERLADFGVDEEAEFYDEEDIPLAELMRRKQQGQGSKFGRKDINV